MAKWTIKDDYVFSFFKFNFDRISKSLNFFQNIFPFKIHQLKQE